MKQTEIVKVKIKANDIFNIVLALKEGSFRYKSNFWSDKLVILAADFQGMQEMAFQCFEHSSKSMLTVELSHEEAKLLLRALRTKVYDTTRLLRFVDSAMWSDIYYGIRDQIDKSIWKTCQKL